MLEGKKLDDVWPSDKLHNQSHYFFYIQIQNNKGNIVFNKEKDECPKHKMMWPNLNFIWWKTWKMRQRYVTTTIFTPNVGILELLLFYNMTNHPPHIKILKNSNRWEKKKNLILKFWDLITWWIDRRFTESLEICSMNFRERDRVSPLSNHNS